MRTSNSNRPDAESGGNEPPVAIRLGQRVVSETIQTLDLQALRERERPPGFGAVAKPKALAT